MTTDQKMARSGEDVAAGPSRGSVRPRLSRSALVASIAVGVVLVAWFFFAWLALNRHVVDAAGESMGSGFALLLLISIVGAVLRGRGQE